MRERGRVRVSHNLKLGIFRGLVDEISIFVFLFFLGKYDRIAR